MVIDSHYLCHRAFHSTRNLEWRGRATGVIFGFLRDISYLQNEFPHSQLVFCFEGQTLKRRELLPSYKSRRKAPSCVEEKRAYLALKQQIADLRCQLLKRVGFRNIFCEEGYESDDLLAQVALQASPEQEVILVTGDYDLFQCLRHNVSIYLPQKQRVLTKSWFETKYGIHPTEWALVKAIAGCTGDNVPGVRGVGEKTALKFVKRDLPSASKAFQSILCPEGKSTVRRNRLLVQLPFSGCPFLKFQPDQLCKRAWFEMTSGLGMRSIAHQSPI